jgi:hypothetical protein
MAKANAAKQISNLRKHGEHIRAIGTGSVATRNAILRDASPGLVQALATTARLAHENGWKPKPAHARRFAKLHSPNTAKRTKKRLVSGEAGKTSRGGSFFSDLASSVMQIAPSLLMAL